MEHPFAMKLGRDSYGPKAEVAILSGHERLSFRTAAARFKLVSPSRRGALLFFQEMACGGRASLVASRVGIGGRGRGEGQGEEALVLDMLDDLSKVIEPDLDLPQRLTDCSTVGASPSKGRKLIGF